ncbi:MAG: PT domain-containing protein [Candidatus Caccosoma sp.]|nr:PT domain-containing protein [Candidatus Caccosoma sp.]
MKRKGIYLLSLVTLFSIVNAKQLNETNNVLKAEENNIVEVCKGTNGLMKEDDWTNVKSYSLTGANEGVVKFAIVETKFFFRFEVKDETNFSGKDKIDFEITTNGKHQGQQGNFDPWLTGLGAMDFGNNIQTDLLYNATLKSYIAVIGFDLKDSMIKGNDINVTINFHDVTDASQNWGDGAATSFNGTLKLIEGASEPITNTDIIKQYTGVDNKMTASDWENVEKYSLVGENEGYLQFALIKERFFFKLKVNDDTYFKNKEKIDFEFTTNGKHQGQQGNFDPWLTALGTMDFGDTIQLEMAYNQSEKYYTAVLGFDLGSSYLKGNTIDFSLNYHNADESQSWGDGKLSQFSKTLYFEEYHEHTFETSWVSDETNHYHKSTCGHDVTSQFGPHTFDDGVVKIEPTEEKEGVKLFTCTICKYTKEEPIQALGHTHTYEETWSHDENNHFHKATCKHKDEVSDVAAHSFTEWTNIIEPSHGVNGSKERTCTICNYKDVEVIPYVEGQVNGPENVDLGITIKDIISAPKDADWQEADSYDLIPIYGDTYGAKGYIKILSSNNNLFWQVMVDDETTNINTDGLYICLKTVGEEATTLFEARGNFDFWLAEKVNNLGSPSLFTQATTAADPHGYSKGTYTYSQGFYLKDLLVPGNQIELIVKFRDSRSEKEAWADADYMHTIYFDQVITFGKEADKTIRPQEPTNGFTGNVEKVSYNKGNVTWKDIDNADSYRLYVYAVNKDGSEEPYEHLTIEGPIYAGDGPYSETLLGLSESSKYVVQIVAYDKNDKAIAYSSLISLNTISKEEAMDKPSENPSVEPSEEPSNEPSNEPSKDSSNSSNEEKPNEGKRGCKGMVGSSVVVLFALLATLKLKKEKN